MLETNATPMANEPLKRATQSIKRGVLAAALLLVASALVYQTQRSKKVFTVTNQPTIAVLQCESAPDTELMLPKVLTMMLDTEVFTPVDQERVTRVETAATQCEPPTRATFDDLSQQLNAEFILWSRLERGNQDYVWRGMLYQRHVGSRRLRARAETYPQLLETIQKACLRLLKIERNVASPAIFISEKDVAQTLYTEADTLAKQGKIPAARERYRLAGSLDPHFYSAQIEWAKCLYMTGHLKDALSIIEDLVHNQGEQVPSLVLLDAYKQMANIYFRMYQRPAFNRAVAKGQILAERFEDKRYFLYFLLLDMSFQSNTERFDKNIDTMVKSLEFAHHDDVETQINILSYKEYKKRNSGRDQEAYHHLSEARELARRNNLFSKEALFNIRMANIALKTGDPVFIRSMRDQLESNLRVTDQTGNLLDSQELTFSMARCANALGEQTLYHALLEEVAIKANLQNNFRLKIRVDTLRISIMLSQGKALEAERLITELQKKYADRPPLFKLWIDNRWVFLFFNKGEYEKALKMAQKCLSRAEFLGSDIETARALNNIGEVLEKLDRNEEALDYYQRAWNLKRDLGDPTIKNTAQNLARLCDKLGQPEKAKAFQVPEPDPKDRWWEDLPESTAAGW